MIHEYPGLLFCVKSIYDNPHIGNLLYIGRLDGTGERLFLASSAIGVAVGTLTDSEYCDLFSIENIEQFELKVIEYEYHD